MANNVTFNFTGKISLPKETEKFKPIEKKEFSSKWCNNTVKFNVISGTNRVLVMCQGGKWSDDSKNTVKTFGKSTTDANGNVVKGTSIDIPWAKRFNEDEVAKVAGFKKFIVDTGDYKQRYKLQDLVKAFENGKATNEQMEALEIYNLEDAKTALEKSQAKRREFISEWDFVEFVIKLVSSDKYKNALFNVSGNYEVQYSTDKDRFYNNYHVNRITLAAEDAEPKTEMKADFFYGEDSWDDSTFDKTGKCIINGWITYYDSNLKKTGFKPTDIVVRESDENVREYLKKKFSCDDEIKEIGLTLSVIDGAEVIEITMDMLDEETREEIELGLLDFEKVKKELGGKTVGDKVRELRFVEFTASKNKPQDTTYSIDDMHPAREEVIEEEINEDIIVDLFDGSDDDDEL